MCKKLDKYKRLTHFLGSVLGKDYEVVLHWRDAEGSYYIAAIEHSYISGRNLNSPITGFALQLVKKQTYLHQDFVSDYKASAADSKSIQGSTYFIKGEDDTLLGLLCINFDPGRYVQLADNLLALTGMDNVSIRSLIDDSIPTPEVGKSETPAIEFLHSNVEESIRAIVDPYLLQPGVTLTQETRTKIVQALFDQGVFQIKGALPHVAEILGVSDQTIYRYLRNVEK